MGGLPASTLTSSPTPPYSVVYQSNSAESGGNPLIYGIQVGLRIYKKGAAVGDQIGKGDTVYFNRNRGDRLSPNYSYTYLGSSNISVAEGIELYHYEMLNNSQPPLFEQSFLWVIDSIETDPAFSQQIKTYNTTTWPAASDTQF
jgi:hypothetical protein